MTREVRNEEHLHCVLGSPGLRLRDVVEVPGLRPLARGGRPVMITVGQLVYFLQKETCRLSYDPVIDIDVPRDMNLKIVDLCTALHVENDRTVLRVRASSRVSPLDPTAPLAQTIRGLDARIRALEERR